MRIFASVDELAAAVGQSIGPGSWYPIEQRRVDLFADATDDHQWIHLDPVRAAAGPYGATVAHGYLTLALLPALVGALYRVEGVRMGVNYGLDRVRFPAPARVGGSVRATATITAVTAVPGGVQLASTVSVAHDAVDRPVCVAETLIRLYVAPPD